MVISGFQELKARLQETVPAAAVVAAAHDEHTLEAVFQARTDGLIRPILVGERERIRTIARTLGQDLPEEDLVEADSEADCARRSIDLIRQGRGTMLIKGMVQTGTLLKEVVRPDTGIRASQLLSHVAILDVPAYHKLMFVSDGGMVVAPDLAQKREILRNVLSLCRFLGYEMPKAAILCAAETVSPRMEETVDAAQLKQEGAQGDFGPCLVEGPISFDLAVKQGAAAIKGYESPVAGDADLLVVPDIACGNILVKCMTDYAGALTAGTIVGAKVPVIVTSRSAEASDKYYSIALAAYSAASY